jgi:hypothetical protein
VGTNTAPQENPDTSNEQLDFEISNSDEEMPEAETGGSSILPKTSTSKLSASIGMSEEDFENMKAKQPDLALQLLLAKKWEPIRSSSNETGGSSTQSDVGIKQSVRQDSMLLKLHREYLNGDALRSIEENPSEAFAHKNFLSKFHNPHTDEATLGKVIQLESIIEQLAKAVQKKDYTIGRISYQKLAQAAVFDKANTSIEKVAQIKSE